MKKGRKSQKGGYGWGMTGIGQSFIIKRIGELRKEDHYGKAEKRKKRKVSAENDRRWDTALDLD